MKNKIERQLIIGKEYCNGCEFICLLSLNCLKFNKKLKTIKVTHNDFIKKWARFKISPGSMIYKRLPCCKVEQ